MQRIFKAKTLKGINYLELTPHSNCKHQVDEKGRVTVYVPKFTTRLWGKILMPLIRYKYINVRLDEIGSSVWLLMDGKNKVSEICSSIEIKFGERVYPAEKTVTKFLSGLYFKKIINFYELIKEKKNE